MEPFLGEVRRFAFEFTPERWLPCDGSLLSINQNTALFALVGTRFGGDGRTTFALPTIADQEGLKAFIAVEGVFPSRV